MMRLIAVLAAALLASAPAAAQDAAQARQRAEWNQPMAPFRIAGNVYYVGTAGLAAYLIVDPRGMILIDGGLPESAPDIAANILSLGFELKDVHFLLINHAHYDHAGGLARLKLLTGAKLLASIGDRPDLERGSTAGRDDIAGFPPVKVDRVIADGEHIRLGGIDLTTIATPGHTRGCTSWTYRTWEGVRPLTLLFACSLSVAGQDLTGGPAYLGAAGDYRRSFAKLRSVRADIFLTFHPELFDMAAKRARQAAGNPYAFVDPAETRRRVDAAQKAFDAELARQQSRKAKP
jgi:metallo-beta-lactamase class B